MYTIAGGGRYVQLLGRVSVHDNGQTLNIPRGKPRHLLAYLALHGRTQHPRERLAALLWPDAPLSRGRRLLSDALYRLRQVLGEQWLHVGRGAVGLNLGSDFRLDVWEFEQSIRQGTRESLERAVSLYRGDLLADIEADWALAPRVALRESYLDALEILARLAEEAYDTGRALGLYRQLSQADLLRESSYRGIMRILAKENRFTEALEIYESLKALLARELDAPPEAATRRLAQALQDERDLLAFRHQMGVSLPDRLPFVGRQAARATATRAIELALGGHGGVLLVEGEAGMGKTRFLETIRESATWRGAIVVEQRIGEYPASSPLGPLEQVLSAVLGASKTIPVADLLSPETLAALAIIHPAWRARAPLAQLPAAQARLRFHHALSEFLALVSDFAPLVLIFDDMHRAEPSLWEALSALTPSLRHRRLLLILGHRPDETPPTGWSHLRRWEGEARLRVARLEPLSLAEMEALLPEHVPASAQEVRAITGGNPFFIQEYLLGHDDDEPAHQLTIAGRAANLPAEQRAALEAAAVLGDRFSFALWRDLLQFSNHRLAQIGTALIARVLLHLDDEGYHFVHDLVQEAVYKRIPEERRRLLHARAAELLAGEDDRSQLRLLALHLDRSGQAERAADVYIRAGRYEIEQLAFPEADFALSRGLELAPEQHDPTRIKALLDLAYVCQVIGNRERQRRSVDEALALARELDDEDLVFRAMLARGDWAIHAGHHDDAARQLQDALALAEARGHDSERLEVQQLLGDLYLRMGRVEAARTSLQQALVLARLAGDRRHEGRALDGLAWSMIQLGQDQDMALEMLHQALAALRESGDALGEARTLLNLFSVYENIGAWDRMETMADEVLAAQKRAHYWLGESIAHQSLGMAAYALGDFDLAWSHAQAAREGFEAVGEQAGVIIATDALGLIAQARSQSTEAERYFRSALHKAEAMDAAVFVAYAKQDLAFLLHGQGRNREATSMLREAIDQWRECGDALNELKCEALLGLALFAQGEEAESKALARRGWHRFRQDDVSGDEKQRWLWTLALLWKTLEGEEQWGSLVTAAYAELQRLARGIADDTARERFFHAVPLNGAIVAARDELAGVERRREVLLARAEAPLGRPLREEERVRVTWTVSAPEDESIADKAARRRFVLTRLLREAATYHAAPTDHDLAAALGVSRRTILRDMAELAQTGIAIPTRRRASATAPARG
ncbi:MAG: DUF1670 domain-containing protein [Caldilineae bacterium]|nr:MAG: DUF1670 domain-containing protein [Caldilineae bacterium]